MVAVAQLVRAPGCGPGGRGFKSPQPPHFLLNFPHIAVGKAQVSLDWLHHGDALFSRAREEACYLLIVSI